MFLAQEERAKVVSQEGKKNGAFFLAESVQKSRVRHFLQTIYARPVFFAGNEKAGSIRSHFV